MATPAITRLTSSVWLVSAIGERKTGTKTLATTSVAKLYRLNQAQINVNAGLTAIGKITVGGNSEVSGYDVTPPSWLVGSPAVECPALGDVAAIRYNGPITASGSADIHGSPKQNDNSMTASNMLGNTTFNDLKAMATKIIASGNLSGLAPVTSGSPAVCNTTVESNWGAPDDKSTSASTTSRSCTTTAT